MFELTINDAVYQFKFGMGFLREINKKVVEKALDAKGGEVGIGLQFAVANLFNGNLETLVEVLELANKGFKPRLTKQHLDKLVEDDDTDIDELFNTVIGFLEQANVSKKTVHQIKERLQDSQSNQ